MRYIAYRNRVTSVFNVTDPDASGAARSRDRESLQLYEGAPVFADSGCEHTFCMCSVCDCDEGYAA